jgi:small subunit ribosomal protein S3Ae
MARGGKRGGRVRDKWRDKQWLVVNSPASYGNDGNRALNYIPISNVENSKGKVIENTLYDIRKRDMSQHQIKVFVAIEGVHEGITTSILKCQEYGKEFLRSLIRRGSSMVTFVHDYTTSDGFTFRINIVAFSQKRLNSSKKHAIRIMSHQLLNDKIPKLTVNQFVEQIDPKEGDLNLELLSHGKKIALLRHIGIKKAKLLSYPEDKLSEPNQLSLLESKEKIVESEKDEDKELIEEKQQ